MTEPTFAAAHKYYSLATMLLLTICPSAQGSDDWQLSDMKSGSGRSLRYHGKPADERFRNPWPADEEARFQARAAKIIAAQSAIRPTVNTYFENEKRNYGFLMAGVLSEDKQHAAKCLEVLQTRDHQHEVWHRETAGIDYYAAFTIKHQMRKFFYFGDVMEPAYRKQMFDGGKAWDAAGSAEATALRVQGWRAWLGAGREEQLGRCAFDREPVPDASHQRVSDG